MHSPTGKDVRLPPLAGIQAFEAAARLGSFERASEALCITASAVGKRVVALEAQLGVSLFVRRGRGLDLSLAGKEYLEQVRSALELLSNASLHQRVVRRREPLRIVSTPTFARQILVPHLAGFTERHPDVEIELLLSIPYLEMGPPYADLQIRFGTGSFTGLISQRLTHDPVFAVCSPAYLAAHPGLRSPADIRQATLLRCPLEPWRPWLMAAGVNDSSEPEGGVRMFDLGMMLEAARAGMGVGLARDCLVRQWLDEGKLVRLFDITVPSTSDYYLCRDASQPFDEVVDLFATWLTALTRNGQTSTY